MILVGIGSNLPSDKFGSSLEICKLALTYFEKNSIKVLKASKWYRSAPLPVSQQPWYVNGVASVSVHYDPETLLKKLLEIELEMGRVRKERNEARLIDLDLLAYHEVVKNEKNGIILPHYSMHERAFVLLPLRDIAPNWIHPLLRVNLDNLIKKLPKSQKVLEIND